MITKREFLTAGASVLSVSLAGCLGSVSSPDETAQFSTAISHLSSSCDCCTHHAEYLKQADADVEIVEHDQDNLIEMKTEYGIPSEYMSCHTTELESGYVIEGHVPVEVINEVVEREPDVGVVGLPGMPSGSPGMPGSKDEEWVFYAIDEDGNISEFTRR